jgi:uncharacterized protein (DUF2249 family)
VREFEHPVPFEKVVSAYSKMQVGDMIHMIHRKKPVPLFEFLTKQPSTSFNYEQDNDGIWHIYIHKH